jgi:hypothetical protein
MSVRKLIRYLKTNSVIKTIYLSILQIGTLAIRNVYISKAM